MDGFKTNSNLGLRSFVTLALVVFMAQGAYGADACTAFFASGSQAGSVVDQKADVVVEAKPFTGPIFGKNIELQGVRLQADREAEQVTSKKDPRYQPALSRLLRMLSDAIYLNASEKMTIEKGELRLGRVLSNGLSIEFEYEADTRAADMVFHLKKIIAFKPNGQEIQLSKEPLTDDGRHLKQRDFVFAKTSTPVEGEEAPMLEISALTSDKTKEMAETSAGAEGLAVSKAEAVSTVQFLSANKDRMVESDQEKVESLLNDIKTVEVPVMIKGEMLDEVLSWAKRLEYVKRSEIRSFVDSGKVNGLVWKARWRNSLEFMADRALKKLFGAALMVGLIIGGGAAWDEWEEFKESVAAGNSRIAKEQVETIGFSKKDVKIIVHTLNQLTEQWDEVDPRLAEKIRVRAQNPMPRNPIQEAYMFSEYIERLWKFEAHGGGKVRLFVGDSNLKGLVEQTVPTPVADPTSFPGAGVMLYQFEKMKQIVIAAVTLAESSSIPSVRAMIIREEEYPVVYDLFKKRIKSGFEQPETFERRAK